VGAVANGPVGFQKLLEVTPANIPWVLEPTGRYSLEVVKAARAAGRRVLLAPPRKAKAYLQSISTRAKTDRLDSRGLALFAASRSAAHPLPEYPLKSAPVEQLDQLLTARRGITAALTSLKLRLPELPHAATPLEAAVGALQAQQRELERQIAALTRAPKRTDAADTAGPTGELLRRAAKLRQVPGIGTITAAAAVSRLAAKGFTHPDQFVAYMGLDIGVRESGKRKGEWGLTKHGDAELRRLFYLAAQAAVRVKDSPFRTQYEQQRAKGKSPTAAYNVVARKLAKVCWSLFTHDATYDPARVYQQPPRTAAPTSDAPPPETPTSDTPAAGPPETAAGEHAERGAGEPCPCLEGGTVVAATPEAEPLCLRPEGLRRSPERGQAPDLPPRRG
jgi:transposase